MRSSESFGLNMSECVMTTDNSRKRKPTSDIVAMNEGIENCGRAVTYPTLSVLPAGLSEALSHKV